MLSNPDIKCSLRGAVVMKNLRCDQIQWLSLDPGSGIAAVFCREEVKGIGLVIFGKEFLSRLIKMRATGKQAIINPEGELRSPLAGPSVDAPREDLATLRVNVADRPLPWYIHRKSWDCQGPLSKIACIAANKGSPVPFW